MPWRFRYPVVAACVILGMLSCVEESNAQESSPQAVPPAKTDSALKPGVFGWPRGGDIADASTPFPAPVSPVINLRIPLAVTRPCGGGSGVESLPGCEEEGKRRWAQSAGSSSAMPTVPAGIKSAKKPGIHWKGVLWQSFEFISIEHGLRMAFDPPSRRSMSNAIEKGEFWQAYVKSIKSFSGWSDGNHFFVNYVGHPMQGAVTGFILVHNDPKGINLQFGKSRGYWISRLKAMGWSTVYSIYWELGFPLSEAAIGNLGPAGRPGIGAVDSVVTETVGTAYLVLEDVLDRYVVRAVERKLCNPAATALTRSILNLDRSFANLLRWKFPWYRDTRGGLRACGL